jgi:hypothetical protein
VEDSSTLLNILHDSEKEIHPIRAIALEWIT